MKTFHAFCENAYSIDKRPCPDGYKWTKKYISCVPKGSRWKTYGARWGGVGYRDESEDDKNGNGKTNGSNGNGHSNGSSGNGNGGNGNGGSGGGNGGGGE